MEQTTARQLTAAEVRATRDEALGRADELDMVRSQLRRQEFPSSGEEGIEARNALREKLLGWADTLSESERDALAARLQWRNNDDVRRSVDRYLQEQRTYAERLGEQFPEAFDPVRLLTQMAEWVETEGRSPEPELLAAELRFVLGELKKWRPRAWQL